MRKLFTLCLIVFLMGFNHIKAQEPIPWNLENVTENFQIFWLIDTPEDLIWLTDTLNLDPNNDGTNDFATTAEKWDANYRLTSNIVFNSDSSLVDWNNDGTVDIEESGDSIGLKSIGDWNDAEGNAVFFSGHFDGQYYTIFNPYIGQQTRGAMFGNIKGATIENLRILNLRAYPHKGYYGGIAARATEDPGELEDNIISRCWVEGSFNWIVLNDGNLYSGGIIGRMQYGEISECVTKVSAVAGIEDDRRFAGIIGQMQGEVSVTDCYSIASVHMEEQFGGLLGRVAAAPEASIENCYAVATLTGAETPDQRGIFAGDLGSTVPVSCYYDNEVDPDEAGVGGGDQAAIDAVVGLAAADFSTEANFTGWDFTNTWMIGDVDGVQRPYLQWQEMAREKTNTKRIISGSEMIHVYPNPVENYFTIELNNQAKEYKILNVLGQIMESGTIESQKTTINISDFKEGIYLLKVDDLGIKRIIKK